MKKIKFEPDVTIITAIYGGDLKFIKKIADKVKNQRYAGKVKHIFINDDIKNPLNIPGIKIINNEINLGIAGTLNKGFKLAKTKIVISLFGDCLPSSEYWLRDLINPLLDKSVVATSSMVELPREYWDKQEIIAKILTAKEQKPVKVELDGKGCAYRKEFIEKCGYLNSINFKTGGEDADLNYKLKKFGKILNTNAKVYHVHPTNSKKRIRKEIQYAELSGRASRILWKEYPVNFKLSVIVQITLFLLFFITSFISIKISLMSLIMILVFSNRRLPEQMVKMYPDWRIVFIPILNLVMYFIWIVFFFKSFILNRPV